MTGTPGTGKSTLGTLLSRRGTQAPWRVIEVRDLLAPEGRGRHRTGAAIIDMALAARRVRKIARDRGKPVLLVGHLAHLLPVSGALLLRCRPDVLRRRLLRRGVKGKQLQSNVEAEMVDVILLEALALGRRIWEIDTTDRTPSSVAGWARSVLRGNVRPHHGMIDWLAQDVGGEMGVPRPKPRRRRRRVPP
ncbi:MAG: AAA family ATPase [Euryarchaeota archaeon]|nr:AAA family ATPase [Euryarchaeota archaeon]MDE1836087.1 AAA family ATPase [Euryarchaeota archaeon]MDE1879965.1 AAA family ATPase [Euryarchaeota archaeon]MDE2044065.1 AAA family ATPase [Thermoplasmata archaeon]